MRAFAQPQPDDRGFAGADVELIVRGGLGSGLVRVDGLLPARHDVIVDPILDIGRRDWVCRKSARCWSRFR